MSTRVELTSTPPVHLRVGIHNAEATRALAQLAVFSAEAEVRNAAVAALKERKKADYTPILMRGLRYPWPAAAQYTLQANLERLVSMHRDRKGGCMPGFLVDVMTAVDPVEIPPVAFQDFAHLFSGDGFQSSISSSIPSCAGAKPEPARKQPSTASRRLANNSARVSPWVKQPGRAGTSAQKPPSSAS